MAALLTVSLLGAQSAMAADPEPICKPKLYDIISSAFHQSVAQMNDGGWKIWGERGIPETMAHAYAPVDLVLPESAPGVRPKALLVTVAGTSNADSQDVVLGNDGAFYAWGNNNAVLPAAYTSSATLHKTSLPMPPGVSAGDVEMMMASTHFLVIVTSKTSATQGAAFVLLNGVDQGTGGNITYGANASLVGNGSNTVPSDWRRVKTDASTDLKNIIAVRAHVSKNGNGAAIALTEEADGTRKLYTWGNGSRVADVGSGVTVHSYATELTPPPGATGKPKQVGVTGNNDGTDQTAFYVLYTEGDPNAFASVGTLWSMGQNSNRQLGDLTTNSSNTWRAVKKPQTYTASSGLWTGDGGAITDVRMFSVQEHDAGGSSKGSGALIVENGDVYTWGSNSGAMIGGKVGNGSKVGSGSEGATDISNTYTAEGDNGLDTAIRGYLMDMKKPAGGGATSAMGNIKAHYIELGGHTTAFLPVKKPQYCYVGHKVNGSMGDGQADAITQKWQFQCEGTAAMTICGSDAIVASNDTYAPISVPNVAQELPGNAYANDEWQGEAADTRLDKITGEVLTPATAINWGPVPYLDVATGKVIVPAGTNPGDYTIRYRIKDKDFPATIYADASITVSVLGIKALPDTATTLKDQPVTTKVTANDTTPSGEPINENSVTVVSQPPNGAVVCKGDAAGSSLNAGECQYTPKPGFKGTDTYTYKVCNSKTPTPECDTTTVTVAVGEPPSIAAYPDADATAVNVPVTTSVLANDIAVGGTLDPVSVQLQGGQPANATVTCANGYCTLNSSVAGTYTYTYKVCMASPNQATCTTSTVEVLVTASAGAPGITAAPDFATTPKNTAVATTVLHNDKAVGGTINPGSVSVTGAPGHGSTSVDPLTGKITYTPATDFVGTDTYTYQVCLVSPNTTCTSTTVTVKVGDPAITAQNDSAKVVPGGSVTTEVLRNDTAVGGELDPASVTIVTTPTKGTATPNADGTVTYTPNGGFDGTDTYTYKVCLKNPKEVCSTATVAVSGQKPDVYAHIQSPAAANPGDKVTALLTFGNQGDLSAAGVTYQVTGLPQGLGTVACDGATCHYDSVNQKVTITGLPTTLAPTQQSEVLLHWTVPASAVDATVYTLQAKVTTTTPDNPLPNDQEQAQLTVQTATLAKKAEVTTLVQVPASGETGKTVSGTVTYLNIGSETASAMTYAVTLSAGTPTVLYKGTSCTVAVPSGALSGCNLPETLEAGKSLELTVSYPAPAADASVTLTSTVGASNDVNLANNSAAGSTKALAATPAPTRDVTVSVAPPATALPGAMVSVPVTFENLGPGTAEDVTYKVTLPPGLTDVSCEPVLACAYNVGTGEVTWTPGSLPTTLLPGDKTEQTVKYKAPTTGTVTTAARVDAKDEPVANQANNTAAAQTRIVVPGSLTVVKKVYEDKTPLKNDVGGSCGNTAIAKAELLIVEKTPTMHTLVWCFTVTNNGTEYLSAPVWDDPKLPTGTVFTALAGTTLPLAPGASGTWYAKSAHDRSVLNAASLSMSVTDNSGTAIPGVPAATGSTTSTTNFGMIYDPPFGVKVGTLSGSNVIRWTMVWVNDNPIAANGVKVSDVIKAPMAYISDGTLACIPEGTTTVVSCNYDPGTKTVSAVANFGADLGKTVTTANNRLFISFNVSIPSTGGSYTNQADASWTPPGGLELTGKSSHIAGMTIAPVTPGGGVPVVTLPPGATGDKPTDPASAVPTPVAAPSNVAAIPVDHPLALLAAALGIMGLMARRQAHRRTRR